MPNSNDLFEAVAFDAPVSSSDGYGGTVNGWSEQFACRGQFMHLRGGEGIQAARLEGRHPLVIRVRASVASRAATTDWRIRNTRTAENHNIRSIEPSADRRWIDFLVESGVAA